MATKLYVGNLSYQTTDESLNELFALLHNLLAPGPLLRLA